LKVLLTGASSSPGYRTLLELAERSYTVYAVYNRHPISLKRGSVSIIKLDLTEYSRVIDFVREVKPNIVIHMAAYGDVEGCELNKQYAWNVNVEATRVLAKISRKINASRFIYLSTDYVFDGMRGLYREDDIPIPINFYGLTKFIAEEIVKSIIDRWVIVRTSAIYGFGMGRINFGKFLIEALSKGQKVRALIDQYLSPTLNTLLAKAIVEIVERDDINGILHVAGERISRYDFAMKIAKKFGFDQRLIEPITMDKMKWKAKRPRDSSLDCSRAKSLLRTNFHSLDYSLEVFYREYTRLRGVGK